MGYVQISQIGNFVSQVLYPDRAEARNITLRFPSDGIPPLPTIVTHAYVYNN